MNVPVTTIVNFPKTLNQRIAEIVKTGRPIRQYHFVSGQLTATPDIPRFLVGGVVGSSVRIEGMVKTENGEEPYAIWFKQPGVFIPISDMSGYVVIFDEVHKRYTVISPNGTLFPKGD